MYFGIRDDDTSFYTTPAELDSVYGRYWGVVPISLSVVPYAVGVHRWHRFAEGPEANQFRDIADNPEIVRYLKQRIRQGHVEIMLHGFTHEFKSSDGRWLPECVWKSEDQLRSEVSAGKQYLEQLFETRVKVFVPPGNAIDSRGIRAIEAASLHLSGIVGRRMDRPLSFSYAAAYVKRWSWRLLRSYPYPFPMTIGRHRELVAHALTPKSDIGRMTAALEQGSGKDAPFVVSTHYWEFQKHPPLHDGLKTLIDSALRVGMRPAPLSACIGQ